LPIAARCVESLTRKIDACWKSDLAELLKAAATSRIKQAVTGNSVAVTADGFSRDNPADKIVLGSAPARRTAIAKTSLDRVSISGHQYDPRSILRIERLIGASTVSARFRKCETSIANSTQGSQPWNWHRPERCQFLATEVSRDFIPPCPVQISPAQAAALGPAIKADAEP